jgi:hypothetical protein
MSQIALETTSKLSPEAVIEKARNTFVEDHGLTVKEEAKCCLRLEGGGGWVYIQAADEDGKTQVTLEGREWTYQLKQFMESIAA